MSADAEPGAPQQRLIFTYHKSGTVLFQNVMQRVAAALGLTCETRFGRVDALDRRPDIVVIGHSLLGFTLSRPFRGVRIVRDPRDIWVSGYLYHRSCPEGWCVNTDFRTAAPIGYPRVDFSIRHRSERFKRDYLKRLAGRSYQQNLLDRDQASGLAFELAGYTAATLDAMRGWRKRPEVIDIKLETIAAAFDATMRRIFVHLGFDAGQCEIALGCAAAEDVARMDDATLAARAHIHGRELSKWRSFLTAEQVAAFERLHGDLIEALGYERAAPPVGGRTGALD
jgi:hypothetical protein